MIGPPSKLACLCTALKWTVPPFLTVILIGVIFSFMGYACEREHRNQEQQMNQRPVVTS